MGCACTVTFNTHSKSAMSESLKCIVEISLMDMLKFASRSVIQVLCCNVLVGRRHFISCIRH